MKKILYTAPSAEHIARYHLAILEEFREMGFKIYLATGDRTVVRNLPYVDEYALNSGLAGDPTANVKELAAYIEAEKFDIVSSNVQAASLFTRRAVRQSDHRPALNATMCFGFNFDEDTGSSKLRSRLGKEKRVRKCTDLMMVMNSGDYKMAVRNELATTVALVPGTGIDTARYARVDAAERAAARERIGCSEGDFVMTCVGHFDQNHHQGFVVENMLYLPRQFQIYLIGSGENLDACRDRIFKLGLEDVVHTPGHVDDLESYLVASDAMLSACRYEGLPRSIVIGQAMGLPSVVSAVKGNMDLVVNGKNGLTYTLGNPDSFISAMRTMLHDDAMRAAMGEEAAVGVERFDVGVATETIMECYREALA